MIELTIDSVKCTVKPKIGEYFQAKADFSQIRIVLT